MGWTRKLQRLTRTRCRPGLESLEGRTLLSTSPGPLSTPLQNQVGPLPAVPAQSAGAPAPTSFFDALTGASQARAAYGVDGSALAAAVIDTGVNYRHEAFGGGFGPGFKVEAGYDFAQSDGDPDATSWQHGTEVAGLIASQDPAHPGIAPGADLVALRVFNDANQGDYHWIAQALQWVIDNHARDNITVVNLSISDENNYTYNWFANDGGIGQQITALIHQLDGLRIPVVAAAGNRFQGEQGMGFAAIVGDTISVTSTDASDHLAADAQRLGNSLGGNLATDLAAPGTGLTAPAEGNSFTTVSGTSFAAPLVSGAVLLLQQIYQSRFGSLPTVEQLDGWLKAGADPVFDSATGLTIGRLDILKAAGLVPAKPASTPPPAPPIPAPAPPPSPPPPSSTAPVFTFREFRVPPFAAIPRPAPISPPSAQPPSPPAQPPSPPPQAISPQRPAPVVILAPPKASPVPPQAPIKQATVKLVANGQKAEPLPVIAETNALTNVLSSFSFPGSINQLQSWTASPVSSAPRQAHAGHTRKPPVPGVPRSGSEHVTAESALTRARPAMLLRNQGRARPSPAKRPIALRLGGMA